MEKPFATTKNIFHISVIVAALGYFVDIYDLLLFGIVRIPSLKSLGIAGGDLLTNGVFLLNAQMAGMLIGGLIWGVIGDKRGRLTVLFGSIFLYSLANLANAMVTTVPQYGLLRFIAGLGLAGELGAAVTLVTETLHTSKRGYGTALIAAVGVLGAVFAGFIAEMTSWRVSYVVGGVLGLLLLLTRIRVSESGMFESLLTNPAGKTHQRGDLKMLFFSKLRLKKYLACILMGIPLWFMVGILVTFAPEFANELGISGVVVAGRSIAFCYAGISVGGIVAGSLSQHFNSRKTILILFMILMLGFIIEFLNSAGASSQTLYLICFFMGLSGGSFPVFVTVAAEQFGTNLRATVTTTVPNFVRGSVVPMTAGFQMLRVHHTLRESAAIVGLVVFVIAFTAVFSIEETSKKDLNFLEA